MMEDFKVDFFVVGAARSGTTSLYNYLKQHPDLFLPNIKELNYFSKVESNQPQDYDKPKKDVLYHTKIISSAKVYRDLYKEATAKQFKGDISPSYLWDTVTAQRIFDHNPEAKILVTLRDPVERAFSHYFMNLSVGYDAEPTFEKAILAKERRIWGGGNLYLEWSRYYQSLRSYYELFPKEQIKVLIFEDWTKKKRETLQDIFHFLKVDPLQEIDFSDRFNQKVGYKNIKTLNFFRKKLVRNWVDPVLPQPMKDRLKNTLFQKHEIAVELDLHVKEKLKNQFKEEVQLLEALTELPLLEKWGY